MPNALRNFLALALASPGRRSIFIDTGANDGQSTVHVWQRLCADLSVAPTMGRHLLVMVEAQGRFVGQLRELAANLTAQSRACRVEVLGAAAWTSDGFVPFSNNRDPRGAYVGAQRQRGQRSVVHVPSVDFGAYLRRTLQHGDNVLLKLDVERGEFQLLPAWLTSGALCHIDTFLIEWHFSLLNQSEPMARLEGLGLRLALASLLERGCPPRPGGRARLIQHDELQLSRHHFIPGLWERARWHNGAPQLPMPWSNAMGIQAQAAQASGSTSTVRMRASGASMGTARGRARKAGAITAKGTAERPHAGSWRSRGRPPPSSPNATSWPSDIPGDPPTPEGIRRVLRTAASVSSTPAPAGGAGSFRHDQADGHGSPLVMPIYATLGVEPLLKNLLCSVDRLRVPLGRMVSHAWPCLPYLYGTLLTFLPYRAVQYATVPTCRIGGERPRLALPSCAHATTVGLSHAAPVLHACRIVLAHLRVASDAYSCR